jgi:hypothetical protein
MTEAITTIDAEKAAEFRDMVMRLVSAHLMIKGPENVSKHDVLNAIANVLCRMLRGLPVVGRAGRGGTHPAAVPVR